MDSGLQMVQLALIYSGVLRRPEEVASLSAGAPLMCREEDEELRSRKKAEDVQQVRRHLTFLKAACVSNVSPISKKYL